MQPAFQVLGEVEVRDPAGHAIPVRRRKLRALLALLIVRSGRPVSSDQIIDALWGERPPPSARANLHSYIRGLREVLVRAVPDDAAELVTTTAGYRLDMPAGLCDANLFTNLVADGRAASAAGRHADAVDLLTRALRLWRGRAMADLADYAWAAPYAEWLEEARLTALEDREEARYHLGQHTELADRLAGLTADHPLRERLWHLYLLVLHRLGRRAEALAAYERARVALAAEVEVEPGPRLRQLAGEIRADERLVVAGTRPVPGLLPPDVADFTGRAAEVESLVAHLTTHDRNGLRITGVTGMAGIGKTTLAVHVAHRIAGHFPDGQLYANLRGAEAGRSDPAEVLGRFLRALGVDSRAVPDGTVERGELYRSLLAGRKVLVLLDNAADAAQIRPLLPGAATCAVVLTSRSRPTAVEGARWTDLPVFAPDEATLLLGRVVNDRRVVEQRDDAAAIARLCGGLPLAIRIAGARLTARTGWQLRHLVGLLHDERKRLDQLSAGDLEVAASLALSYQGLEDRTQALFRRLGRFEVPDFPAWLADAVLGGPADDELDALVDAHLLETIGGARYRFHDLVRLYARAQEDDTESALRDGFGAYLAIAERMAAEVPGVCFARIKGGAVRRPVDHDKHGLAPAGAAAWFDAELPSLQAVVEQACDTGFDELAFDLAACLEPAADLRGIYSDWERLNRRVMEACQRAGNLRGEAVMLRGLIDLTAWVGDNSGDAMRRQLADATRLLEMFTHLGERAGMSDAAVMRAWALTAQAQWEPAIEIAGRALVWAEETGHTGGRARAHVALAVALGESLRVEEALAHLDRALSAARQHGNARYEATVLQFQGIAYGRIGMAGESEASLNKSLTLSRRYGDRYPEVLSMLTLGRLYLKRGDPQVRSTITAALAVAREYRMAHHTADALGLLGEIELAAGDAPAAVRHLRESVAMWRKRGWLSYQAAALTTLGSASIRLDPAAAREAFEEARQIFERIGNAGRAAELDQLLASV